MLKQYLLTLDLKEGDDIIAQYESHHKPENIWPEIVKGIRDGGIDSMHIYRVANRLVMVVLADEAIDLNEAFKKIGGMPRQSEWELLMDNFQQRLEFAKPGEKWVPMQEIFNLKNC